LSKLKLVNMTACHFWRCCLYPKVTIAVY